MQVVDLTGDWEGRDPLEDYEIINRELALYADELAARPRIVVANKIDVPGTEEACERAGRPRARGLHCRGRAATSSCESPIDPKLYRISALTGAGVDSPEGRHRHQGARPARGGPRAGGIRRAVRPRVGARAARPARSASTSSPRAPAPGAFPGVQVERMVVQTDWENEEAVAFLQHRLKRMGVEYGAREGRRRATATRCASSAARSISNRSARPRMPFKDVWTCELEYGWMSALPTRQAQAPAW